MKNCNKRQYHLCCIRAHNFIQFNLQQLQEFVMAASLIFIFNIPVQKTTIDSKKLKWMDDNSCCDCTQFGNISYKYCVNLK